VNERFLQQKTPARSHYCRVSTDSDEQLEVPSADRNYTEKLTVQRMVHGGHRLRRGHEQERSTKKRKDFTECSALVKKARSTSSSPNRNSICRNTLTGWITQKAQGMGVGVYFEKKIFTLS
jgi:hypothetical protein